MPLTPARWSATRRVARTLTLLLALAAPVAAPIAAHAAEGEGATLADLRDRGFPEPDAPWTEAQFLDAARRAVDLAAIAPDRLPSAVGPTAPLFQRLVDGGRLYELTDRSVPMRDRGLAFLARFEATNALFDAWLRVADQRANAGPELVGLAVLVVSTAATGVAMADEAYASLAAAGEMNPTARAEVDTLKRLAATACEPVLYALGQPGLLGDADVAAFLEAVRWTLPTVWLGADDPTRARIEATFDELAKRPGLKRHRAALRRVRPGR